MLVVSAGDSVSRPYKVCPVLGHSSSLVQPHPPSPLPQRAREGGALRPRARSLSLLTYTAPESPNFAVDSTFPSSLGKGRGWGNTMLDTGFLQYRTSLTTPPRLQQDARKCAGVGPVGIQDIQTDQTCRGVERRDGIKVYGAQRRYRSQVDLARDEPGLVKAFDFGAPGQETAENARGRAPIPHWQ